jgi:two-component system KDP operon response regulator KdpE
VDPDALSLGSRIVSGQYQCIGKPFSYPEPVARLHVGLRRAYAPGLSRTLRVGSLTIDRTARRVCVEGRPVWLTPQKNALLAALARGRERVLSKRHLLQELWGFPGSPRIRTVEAHASRLRVRAWGRSSPRRARDRPPRLMTLS